MTAPNGHGFLLLACSRLPDDLMTAEIEMSSSKETRSAQRKNPEREPDLSGKYRKIGIKAVAAASRAKSSREADGNDEGKKPTEARKGES